jgi:hypothetical protein
MSILTANDAVKYWYEVGGTKSNVVDALSIARAESGWNTEAISPSHDYGWFQINQIHFGTWAIDATNWDDPLVNANAAWGISSQGTNWAPWCTAWVDPGPNCGHGFLAHPQPGSPAGKLVSGMAALLGFVADPGQVIGSAGTLDWVTNAWGELQHFFTDYAQGWWHDVSGTNNTAHKGVF